MITSGIGPTAHILDNSMARQKAVHDNVVLLAGVLRVAGGTRPRRPAYMPL